MMLKNNLQKPILIPDAVIVQQNESKLESETEMASWKQYEYARVSNNNSFWLKLLKYVFVIGL